MSDDEEDNENEDMALLGGMDLLTAKMELSTAKTTLNEKLTENNTLVQKVEELKNGLETQKSDAKDIYFYLHKKLDDNYNVIDNLEKVRVELSDELEQKIDYYEKELEKLRALKDQEIAALEATVQDQEEELFSLKEYKENKNQLENNMKMLASALEHEKTGRQQDIDVLERKMFHEKERIKKEFLIKIKETKQNLLSMTEDQLHTTTKRTIMENEQMTTELQYQSRETERLLKMNTKLRSDNKQLKRSVGLTEEAGREYAKKTHFYQKLIKKLHEKIQDQALDDDGMGTSSKRTDNGVNSRTTKNNATFDDVGSGLAGRRGRDGSSKTEAQHNQRLIRGLREKVESLELNLTQVCNELDATRRQLHRVGGGGGGGGTSSGNDGGGGRRLLDFLLVSLNDAKAEALTTEAGEDLALTMEPSMFPPSLRVGMITKILQLLQGKEAGGEVEGGSSALAEEFSQLFASGQWTQDTVSWGGGGAGGGGAGGSGEVPTMISIAIQTDNVDPITVLRNVDVGPKSNRSFFTDGDVGSGGVGSNSSVDGGNSVNMGESATSRFLRGPVRGWGAPAATYGMPKVSGPKTFRKRRTGLGATGRSVLSQ
jgi:hypothetical protein